MRSEMYQCSIVEADRQFLVELLAEPVVEVQLVVEVRLAVEAGMAAQKLEAQLEPEE